MIGTFHNSAIVEVLLKKVSDLIVSLATCVTGVHQHSFRSVIPLHFLLPSTEIALALTYVRVQISPCTLLKCLHIQSPNLFLLLEIDPAAPHPPAMARYCPTSSTRARTHRGGQELGPLPGGPPQQLRSSHEGSDRDDLVPTFPFSIRFGPAWPGRARDSPSIKRVRLSEGWAT